MQSLFAESLILVFSFIMVIAVVIGTWKSSQRIIPFSKYFIESEPPKKTGGNVLIRCLAMVGWIQGKRKKKFEELNSEARLLLPRLLELKPRFDTDKVWIIYQACFERLEKKYQLRTGAEDLEQRDWEYKKVVDSLRASVENPYLLPHHYYSVLSGRILRDPVAFEIYHPRQGRVYFLVNRDERQLYNETSGRAFPRFIRPVATSRKPIPFFNFRLPTHIDIEESSQCFLLVRTSDDFTELNSDFTPMAPDDDFQAWLCDSEGCIPNLNIRP